VNCQYGKSGFHRKNFACATVKQLSRSIGLDSCEAAKKLVYKNI
jgi:hypothetical protein